MYKISFVGLGKLGCGMFACLASRGHKMLGIDTNKTIVEKIKDGEVPYKEPYLGELLSDNKQNIAVTTDYSGIRDTDITFIMLPTPSDADGGFSNQYLVDAVGEVGRNIRKKQSYHLVVVCSTVIPGSMTEVIMPILEESSGQLVGGNLGLCYNPEFMALGRVIENYRNPSFRIIGESDKKAGDMLEEIYNDFHHGLLTDIYRMSLYNAELAKIANNAFVLTKISFANTIAEMCEKMPTGDARVVLDAVGADERIGKQAFKPGLGYSGTCFPRDAKAFAYATGKYHSQAFIPEAAEAVNMRWIRMNANVLRSILKENNEDDLAILGLTYNPGISSTEESAALLIAQELWKNGITVFGYDPAFNASNDGRPSFKEAPFIICRCVENCLDNQKVCFIATPWDEFKNMKKEDFTSVMRGRPVIVDAYGCNINLVSDPDIDYRRIGTYQLRGNP